MDEKTKHTRALCLDQAAGFIEAAQHLAVVGWPHIVYHLSLLALEEVGKASMIGARWIGRDKLDATWIDRGLESHTRKLQWAVWSPLTKIDPADFEAAREFAQRAHAIRLASLYTAPNSDADGPASNGEVTRQDAERVLSLAKARLRLEQDASPTGEIDELVQWFLDAMSDSERSTLLLSREFIEQYERLNSESRAWISWARDTIAEIDLENRKLLDAELSVKGRSSSDEAPRWRANLKVYTASHALRAKVLAMWGAVDAVGLVWTGKKDDLILQITLPGTVPLAAVVGRISSLAKMVVTCLNIGSTGYFWFERRAFESQMLGEFDDLHLSRRVKVGDRGDFWGNGRLIALAEEHIDHAMHCMIAYGSLGDAEAEPIFGPYLDGLALMAKSDRFYSFDDLARHAFVRSLAAALRFYGGWNGRSEELREVFDDQFTPFMPDVNHRDIMFKIIDQTAVDNIPILDILISAKRLTDLYLIYIGKKEAQRKSYLVSPGDR